MNEPPASRFKRLDVRPILAGGGEPLPAIRRRVDALGPEDGLLVIASFLPSPLIELLGAEGFRSRLEHGAGEWRIYFWRGTP